MYTLCSFNSHIVLMLLIANGGVSNESHEAARGMGNSQTRLQVSTIKIVPLSVQNSQTLFDRIFHHLFNLMHVHSPAIISHCHNT